MAQGLLLLLDTRGKLRRGEQMSKGGYMIYVIFFVLICFVIIGFIFYFKLILYLKRNHCKTWEILGKPSFLNNSIKNNIKVNHFLSRKEYLKLNDPILNKIAKFTYYFTRVYMGIFIFSLILIIFYLIMSNV